MNIKKLEIRAVPFKLKGKSTQIYDVVIITDKAELSVPIDLEAISLNDMAKKLEEFTNTHGINYEMSKTEGNNNE